MITVKALQEIVDHYDLDIDGDLVEQFPALEKAVIRGKIGINAENDRLCYSLRAPVRTFTEEGETSVLEFRMATGAELKILTNFQQKGKAGDAAFKCIHRMCDVLESELDAMPAKDVQVLTNIFSLFL